MTIAFEPKKTVSALGAIAMGLIVANMAGMISKYYFGSHRVALFDLDREGNIPTLYSSVTALLCAGLLAVIATAEKRQKKRDAYYWMGLAAVFLFLGVDDGAAIHENIIRPLRDTLRTSGILYFAWVIPYGIFVIVLGAVYLRFLFSLPAKTRFLILAAGMIYVTGALGGELLGGYWVERHGPDNAPYALITMLEETLEMTGILIFLYALMSHIASELRGLSFQIGAPGLPSVQTSSSDPSFDARFLE